MKHAARLFAAALMTLALASCEIVTPKGWKITVSGDAAGEMLTAALSKYGVVTEGAKSPVKITVPSKKTDTEEEETEIPKLTE